MNSLARFGWQLASRRCLAEGVASRLQLEIGTMCDHNFGSRHICSTQAASTTSQVINFHSSAAAERPPPERSARPAPRGAGGVQQPPAGDIGGTPGPASSSKLGTIYVQSTSNNTICTLVNQVGNPVTWCSAGSIGFKNSRKSTTYAAQATAEQIASRSLEKGYFLVRVVMKGLGYGKQSAVRALFKSGLRISDIHELTPTPYNGCRAPKKRRV